MIPDGKFKKKEHILKSSDFRKVYRKGLSRKFKGGVTLYCLPNDLGYSRIGFSIGSRFVKAATRRNRIRRIFREIYRKTRPNIRACHDIVIIVKSSLGDKISYQVLKEIFLKLAKEAKIVA